MKDQGASTMFCSLFPKVSSAAIFMKNVFFFHFDIKFFHTFPPPRRRGTVIIDYSITLIDFCDIRDSRSTHLSVEVPRRGPFLESLDN